MKIDLSNRPEDGNYSIELKAKGTDPVNNVQETPYYDIDFFGHLVEIGGGYQEYLQHCMEQIGHIIFKPTKLRRPPRFPLDPDPPPDLLADLITTIMTSKIPQAGIVLKEMSNMYGKSFYRALNYMTAMRNKKTATTTTASAATTTTAGTTTTTIGPTTKEDRRNMIRRKRDERRKQTSSIGITGKKG